MTKSTVKTALISVVILGFAAYVYVFEFKRGQEAEIKKDLDTVLLPTVSVDQVTHIEWWTGPNQSEFVDKKDDVWFLTVPHPLDNPDHEMKDRASAEAIKNFLKKLTEARASETVVQGVFDEKTFGLDMPMYEIKLAQITGSELHSLRIGSIKAYNASLYTQTDDEKEVRLAPSETLDLFKKTPGDLREHTLYRATTSVKWVEILISQEGKVVLDLTSKDGAWSSSGDPKLVIDTPIVEAYIKRIENVKAVDFNYEFETGTPSAKELRAFKLDQPYVLVELKSDAGKSWKMRMSNSKGPSDDSPQGAMQASVSATADGVPAVAKVFDQQLKIINRRATDFVRVSKASPTPEAAEGTR